MTSIPRFASRVCPARERPPAHTRRSAGRGCFAAATLFLVAFLLAGCSTFNRWFGTELSTGVEPKLPPDAVVYQCDQGKRLIVRYPSGGKYAIIMFPDREFRLDPVSAASGARYTNGRATLSTKDDEAFLEEGATMLFANCSRAPTK